MTVPPNYSMPPEHSGHGFQSPYGGPAHPQEPKSRNYALIGSIVVGCTVLGLGTTLLIALGLTKGDDSEDQQTAISDPASTEEDDTTAPEEDDTTTPAVDDETGQCLPFEPKITDGGSGDGLELLPSCDDADAFWTITSQSYDIDASVDSEGQLHDNQVAYDLCGDDYGYSYLGELWTNWHWVYSDGSVDSLYCIEALGNPDEDGRLPYTPDDGDCFDDGDYWWTVPCESDLATYKVVGTVVFDDPKDLDETAAAEEATCGGQHYWEVTNVDGLTTSILCTNEL